MRSVLSNEMDLILKKYNKIISRYEENILLMDDEYIKRVFALNYKNLFEEVKAKAISEGKDRGETKYAILKLRRLIAKWASNGYYDIPGGITYSGAYKEFPLFQGQNFNIIPSRLMVAYIQARVIDTLIESHNRAIKNGTLDQKPINNLNDLRTYLRTLFSNNETMDIKRASMLASRYGNIYAGRNEMSDFTRMI